VGGFEAPIQISCYIFKKVSKWQKTPMLRDGPFMLLLCFRLGFCFFFFFFQESLFKVNGMLAANNWFFFPQLTVGLFLVEIHL
jgi:hypothetical protein